MNIEAYDYTVITAVLGMLVVFLSLTVLSLLMVGLKASFGERPDGGRRGPRRRGGRPPRHQGHTPAPGASAAPGGAVVQPRGQGAGDEERKPPPWLAAAVVAYLAGEEGGGPTAEPWFPEFNHFDPWLAGGPAKRRPGGGTAE
jgi:hypothetical protein